MCGICGIINKKSGEEIASVIKRMNDAISHRGPDDSGMFVHEGTGFGQRRLSVIDLSSAGHQPMISDDGNLIVIFNGEIYNFKELKKELESYTFRTETDTEVILAAYRRWGKDFVHQLNGMFAIAILDKALDEVLIFRDRLGIKPLYFFKDEEQFLFASEIRALLKSGLIPSKLNHFALSDYLRYQTVHAPQTIVKDVEMLLPGHFIRIKGGDFFVKRYWSPEENFSSESVGKSYGEVKKDVFDLLFESVERRLIADVPFGAFLSGGIDSSAIVGLMSKAASKKVKTFTVSFEEEEFSEGKYAAAVAKVFKTEHTEIRLKPAEFLDIIPMALKAMDHPGGDGPNTFVVSKVTKEAGITMALSGLGGDEVFAGYDVFKRIAFLNNQQWIASLPLALRGFAGRTLKRMKPSVASNKIHQLLQLPSWNHDEIYPLTRQVLAENELEGLLQGLPGQKNQVQKIVNEFLAIQANQNKKLPLLSRVSVSEMKTYMVNTLLRDTDQMSMAHALEVRVPFLDYKLVEYVLGISDQMKFPVTPKKLLTDSLGNLLPAEVINRPKMGFDLPWQKWLKNELNSFAEEKILSLGKRSCFNSIELVDLWKKFLSGDPGVKWSRLWYLVVLENWLEENGIEEA